VTVSLIYSWVCFCEVTWQHYVFSSTTNGNRVSNIRGLE